MTNMTEVAGALELQCGIARMTVAEVLADTTSEDLCEICQEIVAGALPRSEDSQRLVMFLAIPTLVEEIRRRAEVEGGKQ